MDSFDFVIIGAGPAGEAAAYKARELGAIGRGHRPRAGSAAAARTSAACRRSRCSTGRPGTTRTRRRTTGRRRRRSATTWSTGRPAPPSPTIRATSRRLAGGRRRRLPRRAATIAGRGRVAVHHDGVSHELEATQRRRRGRVSVQASRRSRASTTSRTGRTARRRWPASCRASLVVLGGGPTGCELAQVYVRFGVPTTIVQSGPRLAPTDHPRNSEALRAALERGRRDGPDGRPGDCGRVPGPGRTAHTSSNSTTARPPRATPSCSPSAGRSRSTTSASSTTASTRPGGRPSRATAGFGSRDGLWVIGDPAGPELHTHQAHYQGEVAVRMALGRAGRTGLPRPAPRDLHRARGVVGRADARRGARAPASTPSSWSRTLRRARAGYAVQAKFGHVTIVVDRTSRELVGAAMACPDASAAIHECVVAIKARVTIDVLAETIHAFPSTSRILNGLFADARRELDSRAGLAERTTIRPRRRRARPSATIEGRVVASAPPGSTGSSRPAAGMTTTSAR